MLLNKYKEIIIYLIFGVATTLVNFLVYTLLIEIFQAEMTVSNAVAWIIAVVFAFVTNKIFVFESKSSRISVVLKEMISFFGSRVISGSIEIFLPTLLFKIGLDFSLFGIKGFVAKALVSIIVIVLNYVFSKLFVFKKRGENNAKNS